MTTGVNQPVFSRRSFIAFLFLAPIGIVVVFAIIVVLQVRQFQAMVAPSPELGEFVWDSRREMSRDTLLGALAGFAGRAPGESLHLSPADLTLLLNASPASREGHLRLAVEIPGDSVFVVRTTQAIDAMQGKVAWIFKKLGRAGYLNARVEGRPKLENGRLELDPDRGFLNGQKIPRSALVKRGGLSPGDFISERSTYDAVVHSLASVKLDRGGIRLTRK